MSGSVTPASERHDDEWFDLVELETDRVVGQITRNGDVRTRDAAVASRVRDAFQRSLMARDDELVDELGVCFAGVESIGPADRAHRDLVFRNLGLLAGLLPRRRESVDAE